MPYEFMDLMKKKSVMKKKSGLESMCRHGIPAQGCFLASNMIIYLTRNKKFRVRSRYEVPGHGGAVAGIIHKIHWFSLICIDFHCFALILHGLGMDPGTFLRMACDVDSHALARHIDF